MCQQAIPASPSDECGQGSQSSRRYSAKPLEIDCQFMGRCVVGKETEERRKAVCVDCIWQKKVHFPYKVALDDND